MSSVSSILFFPTHRICHKHIQARERKLQALINKHVGDNKALTITVTELHATLSALGDDLKEQRIKLVNTKVINIGCHFSIGTCVGMS